MEVAKRIWGRIALAFSRGLDAFEAFMEEALFRVSLAYGILVGKVPLRSEKRWWNRAIEAPILVDLIDWTTERLIASVVIWPSLESDLGDAYRDQRECLEEVLGAFAEGAPGKKWSTYWQIDFGLTWDHHREAWVDGNRIAHDGRRLYAYSRGIEAVGEYPGDCLGGGGKL